MDQTLALLNKIRKAIEDGRLLAEQAPINDVKQCLFQEIQLNRNTFMEKQYGAVLEYMKRLCAHITDGETDREKVLMFLDAAILCVSMISEAVKSLANGEYWSFCHQHELDYPEIIEIIDYVDRNRTLKLLNYDFADQGKNIPCQVVTDSQSGMKYAVYKGRKMFFPRGWDELRITDYFQTIILEQNTYSPHCYQKQGYTVKKGDTVVDAGAAEGFFALDVLDIAEKIYLIEADSQWVEALRQTFREANEKVCIIEGFLGESTGGNRVCLDELFPLENINYIKMDIEGYERAALSGAKKMLQRCDDIRCAICSYHRRGDEEWIKKQLTELGFVTDTSRGYMCPDWTVEAYLEAELRRGIVFGRK